MCHNHSTGSSLYWAPVLAERVVTSQKPSGANHLPPCTLVQNKRILYIRANETTAPIIEQCMRRTIYILLIVEIKGNWGAGDN